MFAVFGLDGDTIERRLEQAISYVECMIEQQEKSIQYYREEIKKQAINSSSLSIVDYMGRDIGDLNKVLQSKRVYEEELMMLKMILGGGKNV